ncbi:hypothetical protein IAT38_000763 [Cryptococcus sp. DSM 104549]
MSSSTEMWGVYASLGLQALVPIALGSFKSLKTPDSTKRRLKAAKSHAQILEDDDDDEDDFDEPLTWGETLLFPIMGSAVLLGLWAIIKYGGTEWINTIMGVYFSFAGVWAMQSTFSSITSFILRQIGFHPTTYHIRISAGFRQVFHLPITLPSFFLLIVSIALSAAYVPLGKPYILSNVLALSLATATLALLKLDSFATAFLLLGLLLVYDIFWVFATPVMVTVAKGIDAPIKILSPKSSPFSSPTEFAMLGLGDIVVPGLVIALCLRFDLARYARAHPKENVTPRSSFGWAYFWVGLGSYVVGLAVTMGVMLRFKAAQPALLYLSPACTIGPLILALLRGELKDLWAYRDGPTDEEREKKLLDESIEAASEVAQRARAEVKATEAAGADGEAEGEGEGVETPVEDDSWMNDTGVVAPEGGKSKKKKKGGKK